MIKLGNLLIMLS